MTFVAVMAGIGVMVVATAVFAVLLGAWGTERFQAFWALLWALIDP